VTIKWSSPAHPAGSPRFGVKADPPAVRNGKRSLFRRRNIVIAVSITAALVVAGEISVRSWLGNALGTSAQSMLGGHASVGIGTRPALIDAVTGSVPTLTIHETEVGVCKIQNVTIDATLNNARRQNGRLAVSGSHASIVLPPQVIATMLTKQLGSGMQATVGLDAAHNLLDLQIGGLLHVYEQPTLNGNVVSFTPVSATIAGFAAPSGITNQLMPKAGFQQKLPQLPLAMRPDSVQVTSAGVVVTASGQGSQSQPAAHGTNAAAGLHTC
jgi:hypothetical protein